MSRLFPASPGMDEVGRSRMPEPERPIRQIARTLRLSALDDADRDPQHMEGRPAARRFPLPASLYAVFMGSAVCELEEARARPGQDQRKKQLTPAITALMMPNTGSTVCLHNPYTARSARVFNRCFICATASLFGAGGGPANCSCQRAWSGGMTWRSAGFAGCWKNRG